MSEMIDRVTGAIWQAHKDNLSLRMHEIYPLLARAAIEAMREPTADMQRAWFLALDHQADCNCDQKDVWPAMIDAAIKSS